MAVKISIIGAGSAVFSLNLIRDLCLTPNLYGSTVSLMDIDHDRLDMAFELCRRYADEVGARFEIEKTTDRYSSLKGADFVVNAALAAGHHRLREGWGIARKHGYRMGGSLHIMHDEAFWINFYQLKLFDSIIQDILRICPNAWYIQVANPVLCGITYLGRKYPQAKIVGLCHGFHGVYRIAEVLGFDGDGLTFEISGVNHFIWLTHLRHRGRDLMPLLKGWVESEAPRYWEDIGPGDVLGPKAVDLYKKFGAFPIGDTCTPGGGSWPWWYHTDEETERRWKEDPERWFEEYFKGLEERIEGMRRASSDPNVRLTDLFPPRRSGELTVTVVESIACDIPRILIVNVLNEGHLVPGLPRNLAVEVPALVSGAGIRGIRTSPLPSPIIAYILRDRVAPIELEIAAYEGRSLPLLRQLVLMDPWTRSEEGAEAFLEEIISLPFHEEMREHYCL